MSQLRTIRTRSRRGGAVTILIVLLIAGGVSVAMTEATLRYYKNAEERQWKESQQAVRAAKEALLAYMLFRAEDSLNIASGATGSVKPRLLMLPCPDNLGDNNLDGSQDPHCGAGSSSDVNIVKNILDSGSRFGRLPWHSHSSGSAKDTINDGLGDDFRDGGNNRLWYALSQNMAPTSGDGIPLNLHRLITKQDRWLSLSNRRGEIISNKAAAVVLAPHRGRLDESILQKGTYHYSRNVGKADGVLAPAHYFESIVNENVTLSNADRDGKFAVAPMSETFNDVIAYIDMDELIEPAGFFLRGYKKVVGLSSMQNRPVANSPLANLTVALHSYRNLFGFYPTPANLTATAHINHHARHCAAYHSGTTTLNTTTTEKMTLIAPAAINIQTNLSTTAAQTVTLNDTDFLLADNAALSMTATIVQADALQTVSAMTLARHARLRIENGVLTLTGGALPSSSDGTAVLPAGATVILQPTAMIIVMGTTPLRPSGNLLGWLSEHETGISVRAGDDNSKYVLATDTRAAFLSGATLSLNVTVTVGDDDVFILPAGATVKLEEKYAGLDYLRGIVRAVAATTTLSQILPTSNTYDRRQFAVWLLSDAVRGNSQTLMAPAVLFPWRQKISDANSRDNLHPYPPCFDSRNFYDRKFQLFLQDQPMAYAVADACHYGGDNAACGKTSGLTVSLATAATVALPQAVTLTHSFILPLDAMTTLTLRDGIVQNTAAITLPPTLFPILSHSADVTTTAAFLRLSATVVLTAGITVTFPAATPLIGGDGVVIQHVPALLIYSPAPLPRAPCAANMTNTLAYDDNGTTITLADQTAPAEDITPLCRWLDDEENADGDALYVIRPPVNHAVISTGNDFFLLLGGQMRTF